MVFGQSDLNFARGQNLNFGTVEVTLGFNLGLGVVNLNLSISPSGDLQSLVCGLVGQLNLGIQILELGLNGSRVNVCLGIVNFNLPLWAAWA